MRLLLASILALLFHLLVFAIIDSYNINSIKQLKEYKIALDDFIISKPTAPKQIVKRVTKKEIKKLPNLKPKLTNKIIKQKIVKKEPKNAKIVKKIIKQKSSNSPLVNFFRNTHLDKQKKSDKSNLNLYENEFKFFTNEQVKFIKNNIDLIQQITQYYLSYPEFAARYNIGGDNIVEFYLYPDGSISDLKLIKSSSFSSLDQNSIETIELAYKDYPYPKQKTKIKFYIFYIH